MGNKCDAIYVQVITLSFVITARESDHQPTNTAVRPLYGLLLLQKRPGRGCLHQNLVVATHTHTDTETRAYIGYTDGGFHRTGSDVTHSQCMHAHVLSTLRRQSSGLSVPGCHRWLCAVNH